jgi:prepilin-type N-terminal cleavage/methylation domain-containing protein
MLCAVFSFISYKFVCYIIICTSPTSIQKSSNMHISHQKYGNGFTLVELAIVLMIIGLLIGGILKGQELINNARITTVIRQISSYEAATTTFRDSYGALPGDIASPSTRLPNCSTAPCSTAGNNNGILDAIIVTSHYTYGTISNTSERRLFFLHLAVANLISGIDSSGATSASWGEAFPSAPMGGGFQVGSYNRTSAGQYYGHLNGIFLLMKGGDAMNDFGISAPAILTPHSAASIDRKMDDGLPATGIALGGEDLTGACVTSDIYTGSAGSYIESNAEKHCNMMFRIQN